MDCLLVCIVAWVPVPSARRDLVIRLLPGPHWGALHCCDSLVFLLLNRQVDHDVIRLIQQGEVDLSEIWIKCVVQLTPYAVLLLL